jgi:hypothetical protein
LEYTVILAIILIFYIVGKEIGSHQERKQWAAERKDLYDRIMSKDLREYKTETSEPITYKPVDNSEEEEYRKEQEKRKV